MGHLMLFLGQLFFKRVPLRGTIYEFKQESKQDCFCFNKDYYLKIKAVVIRILNLSCTFNKRIYVISEDLSFNTQYLQATVACCTCKKSFREIPLNFKGFKSHILESIHYPCINL